MKELTIKLNEFEGPLDLLLHLIKEYKMDIYDIPMEALTKQYLAYIHSMKEMELEIAGDYLVMAATLLEIKARTLIPKPTLTVEVEEVVEEDPRMELVERLIEYKKVQKMAHMMQELSDKRSHYYTKEVVDLSDLQEQSPLVEGMVTMDDLWKALQKMVRRNAVKKPVEANLYREVHTVEEVKEHILQVITEKPHVSLEDCFPELTRHAIVTSFLAVLQLVREQSIAIIQKNPYEAIQIVKREEESNR